MPIRARFLAAFFIALLTSPVHAEDVLLSRRRTSKRSESETFDITFFHINDVHAHLDQFSSSGTDCSRPDRGCYGGYSRVKTILDSRRPATKNSLFLDAGDEFQGTLFYNFYKGSKTAETLNQLGVDAMTLGNHEFDNGDQPLVDFINNVTFPILSSNLKSAHPTLNATVKPYAVFEDYNLAVIGVTTPETLQLSSPSNGTTFTDVTVAVQNAIDEIHATTGIQRIVALTHIGYTEDIKLAQQTTGLSLIIGGHSHTPLGNFTGAQGSYPTLVNNTAGDEVFVVTAYRWGEYLGYIDIVYDADGRPIEYHGAPIHLTNTTKQDPGLQAQVDAWREPFRAYSEEVVGETLAELVQSTCQQEECTLGDLMADAMLDYGRGVDEQVSFAIINAGGIRASIDEGNITRGEVLGSFPFGNAIVQLQYTGQAIWDVLDGIIAKVNKINGKAVTSFLQISAGMEITYNMSAGQTGGKLNNVTIGDRAIQLDQTYRFVTLDYLAGGGDNFFEETTDYTTLDLQADILEAYLQKHRPINIGLDGRLSAV